MTAGVHTTCTFKSAIFPIYISVGLTRLPEPYLNAHNRRQHV